MAVPEGTHPDPSPYQSKQHREGATAASPPSAAAPTMPKLDASSPITSRRGVCLQLDFLGLRDAEWSVLNVPGGGWRGTSSLSRARRNVVRKTKLGNLDILRFLRLCLELTVLWEQKCGVPQNSLTSGVAVIEPSCRRFINECMHALINYRQS